MPNIREKIWTAVTPANVEDAQWWEDHLISDADSAKIGTAVQSVNNETPDASGNVELDTLPAGGTVGQVLTKQSSADGDADWDDPASSGHTIQNASGTDMAYRENLQFLNAQVTDDSVNDRTVVDCQGEKGDPGDAATVTVGTVTTLPAGSQATVTNSGTTSAAVFNFGIPKGADGTGVGDMTVAVYDPDGDVATAGGIVDYVAGEIVANPVETSTEDLTKLKIGNTVYKLVGGGTTIVQIPSVVGDSFTYDGTAQGPTVTGLDSTHCTVTGATNTNVGSYTLTIALNDTSTMVWSDLTTEPKTYTYDIVKKSITIPTVTADLVYDGTSQSPTITNPDSSWMTTSGDISATNAGTYTVAFTLDDTSNTEWSDDTTAAKSIAWSIAKASQTISISTDSVVLDTAHLTVPVTVSGAATTIYAESSATNVVGVSVSGGTVTISTVNQTPGTATVTIYAAETSNYNESNIEYVSVVAFEVPFIYGVTWDGTSTTAWTRTDDAALFTDPVPQMSNGNGGWTTGSSPFDTIAPWSGMTVSDRTGGKMVAIPKFYYKLTKTGSAMSLKITAGSNSTWALTNGYQISPAHMDRGDGERDVVYVGKYHCASDYKSKTGVNPKESTTRSAFRTGISALGTGIYQWDYATLLTIQMLYLVEFADWDSQRKIGYGCSDSGNIQNTGLTDSMSYHTGTTKTNRTSYGHVKYRNIEDLWGNVYDFVDGVYFSGSDIYAIKNPVNFSDSTGGTKVGTKPSASSFITSYAISNTSGFAWFMYPNNNSGGDTDTYTTDYCNNAAGTLLTQGAPAANALFYGLFCLRSDLADGTAVGSRIMELP